MSTARLDTDFGSATVTPYGDAGLMVTPEESSSQQRQAATLLLHARLANRLPVGLTEIVPGFESVLVGYDLEIVNAEVAFELVRLHLTTPQDEGIATEPPVHRIPVRFGGDDGPDLADVADELGLSPQELIARLTDRRVQISFLGIATTPFLTGLDLPGQVSRLGSPRGRIPAGSVMLAGCHGLIAPYSGPSGWRIVGRTGLVLSDIEQESPICYRTGDHVQLVAVEEHESGRLELPQVRS